jgi:hypothetical protein
LARWTSYEAPHYAVFSNLPDEQVINIINTKSELVEHKLYIRTQKLLRIFSSEKFPSDEEVA